MAVKATVLWNVTPCRLVGRQVSNFRIRLFKQAKEFHICLLKSTERLHCDLVLTWKLPLKWPWTMIILSVSVPHSPPHSTVFTSFPRMMFAVYKNSFLYPEDGDGIFRRNVCLQNTRIHIPKYSRLQLRWRLNPSSLWLPSNGLHCCYVMCGVALPLFNVSSPP